MCSHYQGLKEAQRYERSFGVLPPPQPGKHDLIFAIGEGSKSDLLITSLDVPESAKSDIPAVPSPPSVASRLKTALLTVLSKLTQLQIAVGAGAVAGLALLRLLLRWRIRTAQPNVVDCEAVKPKAEVGQIGVPKSRSISGPSAAAATLLVVIQKKDRIPAESLRRPTLK